MRILIVHLSDLHFKGDSDSLNARAENIARAARSRDPGTDCTLVLIGGDVAFSGKASEYAVASSFIRRVTEALGGNPVVAVAPGNHDCDFTAGTATRAALIAGVRADDAHAGDDSVIRECTAVQRNFEKFRDALDDQELLLVTGLTSHEYRIPAGADWIVVRCYNTAWTSCLHEEKGTLVAPVMPPASALITATPTSDGRAARFAMSLFHHPYGWLTAGSAKAFQRAIESNSDLVITGHEHSHDRLIIQRPEDGYAQTGYVEAAALQQEGDSETSAFNVILVDVDERKQKFYHFAWRGRLYEPVAEGDWEPLALDASRTLAGFEPQRTFKDWLEDPGIPNGDRAGRSFSDIFIYPDLIEPLRDVTLKRKRVVVKSANVFSVIKEAPVVLVSSPPKSGRTSLAKELYGAFLRDGVVPVYVDATDSSFHVRDGVPGVVLREFSRQYGKAAREAYRQLDPSRRAVIIDNLDRVRQRSEVTMEALEAVAAFAAHVVVLGDNTIGRMTELAPFAEGTNPHYKAYQVRPLNHGLRERLAQQWFAKGAETLQDGELSRTLEEASDVLDTIIGRNYVPAYPIYVVAVLQAIEGGATVDMRASTHGYFYDLLIRLALSGGASKANFDVWLAFLTHVAFEMFSIGRDQMTHAEFRQSLECYQAEHAVGGLTFDGLLKALIARGMLVQDGDRVKFRYPYLYYYFVANHLRAHVNDQDGRECIRRLSDALDSEEASDILLFLAHLSHEPFIVDTLLAKANSLYESVTVATLDAALSPAAAPEVALEYTEKRNAESRIQSADARDERAESRGEDDGADPQVKRPSGDGRLGSGLRVVKILGQILKNFPGTLGADTKLELMKTCTSLGLRCLATALTEIERGRSAVVESMMLVLRASNKNWPEDKLKSRAEHVLWIANMLVSYGVIRSISRAVAARELELIYARAFGQTPAEQLIDISLKLDVGTAFPTSALADLCDELGGLPLPMTVLKLLVLEHFSQVEVPRADRQRTCAKLGIAYKP